MATVEDVISGNNSDYYCNHSISDDFSPLLITGCVSASVCAFLCIIAIACMLLFRLFKVMTHRLILYTLVAILSSTLVDALQFMVLVRKYWTGEHINECVFGGFIMEYTVWVMLLSTLMVTLHLTGMVLFPSHYMRIVKLEPFYLLFPWLFPLLIAWIPFIHHNYGISGPWCWIRLYNVHNNNDCTPNKEGIIEMYAVWYGELFIGLILNNIGMLVIALTLCKRACCTSNEMSSGYRKALKQTLPLITYPITYQLMSSFAIANRVYQLVHGAHSVKWLFYAHAATSPSWGVFAPILTLIYLATLHKVIKENTRKCYRYHHSCSCCKRVRRRPTVIHHKVDTDHLLDPNDHLTRYDSVTVTSPTVYDWGRESVVDDALMIRRSIQ